VVLIVVRGQPVFPGADEGLEEGPGLSRELAEEGDLVGTQLHLVAAKRLAAGAPDPDFYKAKIVTAQHYFGRLLPRCDSHAAAARAGSAGLMALSPEQFAIA
jgi:hypothetical protein